MLGPLTTDHEPVPNAGLLPERFATPDVHIDCVEPLVATVGFRLKVIITSSDDAVHGLLLIVHLSV